MEDVLLMEKKKLNYYTLKINQHLMNAYLLLLD